jgi:hypothetical protein
LRSFLHQHDALRVHPPSVMTLAVRLIFLFTVWHAPRSPLADRPTFRAGAIGIRLLSGAGRDGVPRPRHAGRCLAGATLGRARDLSETRIGGALPA